jgi:DNA repair exonuclease SbcCD ATPase subunit
MIVFEKIRWKNLLSTGNVFTEIELNKYSNALIIGENGAGKSTILDALCFVLFGKPFRKINKPQLCNSINEKNCVVEIEFSTNNKKYKIIRGIKPTIFEIHCDGVFINQDSASKDYQDYLEKFILRMNYKTFCQIVILGSASFTPFMQLTPADRRAVIEDLLDIQVFSVMSGIVKQKLQANKENIEKNKIEIKSKEDSKVFVEKTLENLKENNASKIKDIETLIAENKEAIEKYTADLETITKEHDSLLDETTAQFKLKNKHKKLITLQSQISTNLNRYEGEVKFLGENVTCPTCQQNLDETFKSNKICSHNEHIGKLKTGLADIAKQMSAVVDELNEIESKLQKASKLREKQAQIKSNIVYINSNIKTLKAQADNISQADTLSQSSQAELDKITNELSSLYNEKTELFEERKYIDTAAQLLKDGGIKTKIIKQYLPIINKQINKYLLDMGFFVNFNINEQFEETIKSRYRDEFSYQNFSEGEKFRIDLAILMAWRSIAKLRNSASTNLLIFDEVFDGSLDANGTDEFLKIMWSLVGDTNVLIISHKTDSLIDKFKKVYKFGKVKNFSRIIS